MPLNLNASTGTIGALTPNAGDFPANHAYYVREFLEIAAPELVFEMFGMKKDIEKNSGNKMVFSKLLKLPTEGVEGLSDQPLTEGVTPPEQQFQMVRVETTVNQFGGFAYTTDRLTEESINGITSEMNMRMGEQSGETMNIVIRDGLLGGTNVRLANGAANRDAITAAGVYAADFDYMFKALKLEKVKSIRPMTGGSPNDNTLPTKESYAVVVPVEAVGLLETLDDGNGNTFIGVEKYGTQRPTWPNEYGSFKQFSFIMNTECATVTNAAATPQLLSQTLVFGKGAYVVSKIGASDVEVIIKPLGSGGTSDPLNQRASIGWKSKKGSFIVQPTYMFRYEYSLGDA